MAKNTLTDGDGVEVVVVKGDALWCSLDKCRVRFNRFVTDDAVEVVSNKTGKVLPDTRHPSQLRVI